MGVRKCIISGCGNTQKNVTLSFHKFPSDKEVKNKWISNIYKLNRQAVNPAKYDVVCAKHFAGDCYQNSNPFIVSQLKKGSVPTLFPEKNLHISATASGNGKEMNGVPNEEENALISKKSYNCPNCYLKFDSSVKLVDHCKGCVLNESTESEINEEEFILGD